VWLFALAAGMLFGFVGAFAGYVVIGLGLTILILRILFCFYSNKRTGFDSALVLTIYFFWLLAGAFGAAIAADILLPSLQPQIGVTVFYLIAFAVVFFALVADLLGSILVRFLVLPNVGK